MAEHVEAALVGPPGADRFYDMLSQQGPTALLQIKVMGSMSHPLCPSLMSLVDRMGCTHLEVQHSILVPAMGSTHLEAHRSILAAAKSTLLARIASLRGGSEAAKVQLERLLAASFYYLGFGELRDVPLSVMSALEEVPANWLKQLACDQVIFRELPPQVQRQVWEFDKNLLQADALPLVGQYKYEIATYMRALALDEFLATSVEAALEEGAPEDPAEAALAADATPPDVKLKPPAGSAAASAAAAAAAAAGGGGRGRGGAGGIGGRTGGIQAGGGRGGRGRGAGAVSILLAGDGGAGGEKGGEAERFRPRPVTRKILRKGSHILQALKGMLGSSHKIYSQIIELCMVQYRDAPSLYISVGDTSYVTLRCQLLMSLHDDNNPVAAKDRCHELAWTLDAGMQKGALSAKHISKLEKFFADVERSEAAASRFGSGGRHKSGGYGGARDEQESAGNRQAGGALALPYEVLGSAGMVLRDPSSMHLLLADVIGQLRRAAQYSLLPRDMPRLNFVLKLLYLAIGCKQMMRDASYRMPDPDPALLGYLLPVLASYMVDYDMHGSPPPNELRDDVEVEVPNVKTRTKINRLLREDEVARKVVQAAVLERLAAGDARGAARLFRLLLEEFRVETVVDSADYTASLAQRLAELLHPPTNGSSAGSGSSAGGSSGMGRPGRLLGKRPPGMNPSNPSSGGGGGQGSNGAQQRRFVLQPVSKLWSYAVDNYLIKAVASHTQAHEEVLRLLLEASPQLMPSELATYLKFTLEYSRKSRKRYKEQTSKSDALHGFPMGYLASDIGSDIGSDGWPGITQLKMKGADGVRSVYEMFTRIQGLTADVAPELWAYLDKGQDKQHPQGQKQQQEQQLQQQSHGMQDSQIEMAAALNVQQSGGGLKQEDDVDGAIGMQTDYNESFKVEHRGQEPVAHAAHALEEEADLGTGVEMVESKMDIDGNGAALGQLADEAGPEDMSHYL